MFVQYKKLLVVYRVLYSGRFDPMVKFLIKLGNLTWTRCSGVADDRQIYCYKVVSAITSINAGTSASSCVTSQARIVPTLASNSTVFT